MNCAICESPLRWDGDTYSPEIVCFNGHRYYLARVTGEQPAREESKRKVRA